MTKVTFCEKSANIWQLVGYALFIVKIVIPILIIIFGMIDLGKAVISSDDKAVSKAATSLLKRVIAGVVIFFIPTLVQVIFGIINGYSAEGAATCINCITDPLNDAKCGNYAKNASGYTEEGN